MTDDDDKSFDCFFVNLYKHPVSVRILSDTTNITEQYSKSYSNLESRIKEAGGGGVNIGIPEVGDLGVTGNGEKETEDKIELLQEDYTKFLNTLQVAGFVIINSFRSLKFTTQKAIKYVSVLVDGVAKATNHISDDPEFVLDGDASYKSVDNIEIAKYYDNDDIFSHAYQAGMIVTMKNFKELYEFGKVAKCNDKWILARSTINLLAQTGLDFGGLNLATAEVLRIVGQRWFGKTVKNLYDQGIKIESMSKNLVSSYLSEISDQAIEISANWYVLAGWYTKMKKDVDNCKTQVFKNTEAAKPALQAEINATNELLAKQRDYSDDYPWKIGLCALGGPMALLVGGAIQGAAWEKLKKKIKENEKKVNDLVADKVELTQTLSKIRNLSNSLDEMISFCNNMAFYFKKQGDEFKTWGEEHKSAAQDIEEKWQSWNSEECVNFIVCLNGGLFKQYNDKLIEAFKADEITGDDLEDINALYLKKYVGGKSNGKLIQEGINKLVHKGDKQYLYIKGKWNKHLKWIAFQEKKIQSVNDLVSKMSMDNVLLSDKKIEPTAYKIVVVFKTFGKDVITVDPAHFAKTILGGR